jgi:hypothetical protein
MCRETAGLEPQWFLAAREDIRAIARLNSLETYYARCERRLPNRPTPSLPYRLGLDARRIWTLDVGPFGVENVYDAASLASRLLGTYVIPSRIHRYSYFAKWRTAATVLVSQRLEEKTF